MRIWIDPAKLVGYKLSAADVNAAIAAQNATLAAEVDGLRAQALPALTEAMLAEAIARENNATGEPTCSDFIEARQIVAQLGRVAIPGKGDKP